MTGASAGIRPFKGFQDRTVSLLVNQEQNFIGSLKVTGTESSFGGIVGLGEATSGGPGAAVGNFLPTSGGTMSGPIAYFPQNVTIDPTDECINIGFEQGAFSTYIVMTTAGATDDLVDIIGALHAGQDLILQGTNGKTITIKDTGNIVPPGGTDFDLVDEAIIRGIFDPVLNKWVFYTSSGGGGGGSSNQIIDGNTFAIVIDAAPSFSVTLDGTQAFSIQPNRVDFEDQQIFGIEELRLNDDAGTGEMLTMGATSAQIFAINLLDVNDILDFTVAGDRSFRITDGRIQVFSQDPNNLSASMSFFRDDPSPAIGNALADIDFDGNNSGGFFHTYASIVPGIAAITDGSEKGSISFQVAGGSGVGGVLVQRLRVETDFTQLFDTSLIFDSISAPTTAFTTATQGQLYAKTLGGSVTEPFWRDDAGTETGLFGDPTQIIDGNTFAIVIDAAPSFSVTLNGTQAFSIQPNRVDFEDQQIFGVEELRYNDDAGTGEMVTMGATGAQIFGINILDVNDAIDITHAGDLSARFQDGRFQIFSAAPNTQSASMSFFRDDPSPGATNAVADLDFDGRDSAGNFTTYVQLLGGIGDPATGNEEGNFSIQVMGGAGSLVQTARFGHIDLHNTAIFNDAFMELDEVLIPPNPLANKGRIYLRDVTGTTTPFFLDSSGTETSLIGGGGGSSNPFNVEGTLAGTLPTINIKRTDSTLDNQDIGFLNFEANTASAGQHVWAQIRGRIDDNNNADREGELSLWVSTDTADTLEEYIFMTGQGGGSGHHIDMRQNLLVSNNLAFNSASVITMNSAKFAGDIISNNSSNLGSSTQEWSSCFFVTLNVGLGQNGRILADSAGLKLDAPLANDSVEIRVEGTSVRARFNDDLIFFNPIEAVEVAGGKILRSSTTTEIGIQVGDEALTVGSTGSMILPYISNTVDDGSDTFLDGLFGDVDGAMGIQFFSTSGQTRIYVRSEGTWKRNFAT